MVMVGTPVLQKSTPGKNHPIIKAFNSPLLLGPFVTHLFPGAGSIDFDEFYSWYQSSSRSMNKAEVKVLAYLKRSGP